MKNLLNIFSSKKVQPRQRVNARASYGSAVRIGRIPAISKAKNIIAKGGQRKFDMADTSRLFNSWITENINVNWDLHQGLALLRTRAQDAYFNDPYIRKFVRTLVKYVNGPKGFTHVNKAFEYQKIDGEWDVVYDTLANLLIQDAWWEWNKKPYCTITGQHTLRQLVKLILRSLVIHGEVFIRKVYRPTKENPFGFTLQVIESAYCDERLNKVLSKDRYITLGVEHDSLRKPTAYYFRKVDPGKELYNPIHTVREYVRIEASQIIHLHVKEFPGQLRGIPWITPVGTRSTVLKGYEEAHLIAARSAARKVAVIQEREGAEGSEINQNTVGGTETIDEESGDKVIIKNVAPGETFVVPPGFEFKDYDPSFPQGEAGPFTKLILQGMSSGLDLDYPTLASDLTGVNFSSSKHGASDSRIGYADIQEDLIDDLLKPVHTDWLESSILNGYLKLPMSKFEKFNNPEFYGFVAPQADYYKDIKGKILANQFNIDTMEEILASKGKDFFEHVKQLKREKKIIEKAGLTLNETLKDNSTIGDAGSDNADNKDNADGNERTSSPALLLSKEKGQRWKMVNELFKTDRGEIEDLILDALENNKNGNGKH